MSNYPKQASKHCTKCGCAIPAGVKFCSNCGTPVVVINNQTAKPQHPAVNSHTAAPSCAVCGKSTATNPCPHCGFDSSRDYEHHPTMQLLPEDAHTISHWKAQLRPSAAKAIDMLRKQGWDNHVLNAVQTVLNQAEAGTFTPQHYVDIRKQGWDNHVVNTVQKILNQTEATIFPQHSQKNKLPPTAVPAVPFVLHNCCPACGASNYPTRLYCVDCGFKLNNTVSKK